MKRIALVLPLVLVAAEASAISRYDIDNMSCGKVHAIIQAQGAAILRYRSRRTGITLYDRYVSSRRYCPSSQVIEYVSVPTSDRASCPVNRCIELEPDFQMR